MGACICGDGADLPQAAPGLERGSSDDEFWARAMIAVWRSSVDCPFAAVCYSPHLPRLTIFSALFWRKDWAVPEDQELTDADWRTLYDTLRGSIAMFDMLLAECGNSSETARVVGDARRRREKVLEKIERRLQR